VASILLVSGASPSPAVVRHATLVSSEPAADSVMPAGLRQFRLVFSEPITADLSGASLLTGDGRTIALTTSGDPRDGHALVAPVPALAAGTYRIAWRIVSADGHPVKGSLAFRVVEPIVSDSAPRPPEPASVPVPAATTSGDGVAGPSIAEAPLIAALLRGAGVGTLMALAGLLAFSTWFPSGSGSAPRDHRLIAALAVGAPLLLAAHLVAWMINVAPSRGLDTDSAMTTLATTLGRIELLRVALAVSALLAVLLARRERLALFFAAAALVVSGAIGHSAAIVPVVSIPAKALHLLGAALWLGGLLWLALANRDDPAEFTRAASRVSAVALWAVVVVAVSGVVQTLLFLPNLADVVRSAYGLGVLAKVAGLGVLVVFGAHHRYRVLPKITCTADCVHMSRSVGREVAVMVVVVLLGGLLAYIPPPPAPLPPASTSAMGSPTRP
jgi:copper transport protein